MYREVPMDHGEIERVLDDAALDMPCGTVADEIAMYQHERIAERDGWAA